MSRRTFLRPFLLSFIHNASAFDAMLLADANLVGSLTAELHDVLLYKRAPCTTGFPAQRVLPVERFR